MATKAYHIDSVRNMQGDKKYKTPAQDIEAALNDAYNQIAYDSSLNKRVKLDLCKKRFTGIDVTWDSAGGVYYSNYPKAIVPNISMDMIVNTLRGQDLRLMPTTEKTIRLTANLPVNNLDTTIYFVIKRERIEFYNMESLSDAEIENGSSPTPKLSTIRLDYAIQFKEFELTDEVYFPMGRDYEVKQLALDYLNKEPIIELRNG